MRQIKLMIITFVAFLLILPATTAAHIASPLPQIMKVFVIGQNTDNQATAFYVESNGKSAIVAPYHAWALAHGTIQSSCVLLVGESADSKWFGFPTVLLCDPTSDIVLLNAPPQLQGVVPLQLTDDPTIGEQVYGYGYGSGHRNSFTGRVVYSGPETETALSWQLTFHGYAIQGDAYPGDSGSPVLDQEGNVVGETVAASDGFILASPASAIINDLVKIHQSGNHVVCN